MLHLTRIADVDPPTMLRLFERAQAFSQPDDHRTRHAGRIVATLFYEPSTRTRLSFESAALRLGAQTLGFADPSASSAAKGETLIDTIRTVQRYCDLIVLRHPAEGAAALAAKVAMVPIINAGDGGHEHPTQALFDLFTIWQRFGSIEGRTICLTGDLRFGRTVHSLAKAAAALGANFVLVASDALPMPEHLLKLLQSQTRVVLESQVEAVIEDVDVLYVTRAQLERMDDALRDQAAASYSVTRELLAKARPDMLLMHPLPRVDEIAQDVDEDPRAWYFEQLANGVVMRMALLDMMLSEGAPTRLGAWGESQQYADPPWRAGGDTQPCPNTHCITNFERGVQPRWEETDGERRCAYCETSAPHEA